MKSGISSSRRMSPPFANERYALSWITATEPDWSRKSSGRKGAIPNDA